MFTGYKEMLWFVHLKRMEESSWPNKCWKFVVNFSLCRGQPWKYGGNQLGEIWHLENYEVSQ